MNKRLLRRILFLVGYTIYMFVIFTWLGGISTWSVILLLIGLVGGIAIELVLAKKRNDI
ncbi:hypothetical protein [Culicoidibacter larvae]|uniref:hypothetical protein n=1 Tax=Culicoidibacter larvae TaxID=2579976 RepID=UPI001484CE1A|nr:hypothetical protein [Culicoidibacter larvae]